MLKVNPIIHASKSSIGRSIAFVFVALIVAALSGDAHQAQPQETKTLPRPVTMTAEQDHKRMMDLLHITSLRPGADGRNPQAPDAANYDEAKANPYPTLPDPLVLRNGKKVTTAKLWWNKRRPEIAEDFDREIYGRVPKTTPGVNWKLISTTRETNGDVPVITKRLVGQVDNSSYPRISVDIQLTLTTPANAISPVPVIMEFGFVFPPGFRPPAPPPGAPVPTVPTWQQQVLAKGWGYASIIPNTIQADNGAGLTQGIIGYATKVSRASWMIGARCAPGRGVPVARWIILKPTNPWTQNKSVLRVIRATVRRPSSRWRTTRAWRSRLSVLPAKVAQSFIAATGASW
jgi:hypothetical protein